MELNALQKTITRRKRRLGLGHGSGRVKTSGRGTKGQKARGKIPTRFEGGNLSIVKRLPFLRGKSRNKAFYPKPFNINLEALAALPKGTEVTKEVLLKHGLIKREDVIKRDVKILGKGEIQTPLTVVLQCSKEAVRKIEEAGGTVSHV